LDKKFAEDYGKNDESETALRERLNSLFNINNEIEEANPDVSTSAKYKESVKIAAGMYSTAYFAQMKSVKSKQKLQEMDQVDVFWRACFTFTV